uniref:Uncharacterized protein n=1 Tax=Malurus cyaneus samueli TaxID=2593467 RepID=A0A8C5X5V8_9PASS
MASSDLEDLCFHINAKISNIKKILWLNIFSLTGEDQCRKSIFQKIGNEVIIVHELLNKMETEVKEQEKLKNLLKVMFFSFSVHKILIQRNL